MREACICGSLLILVVCAMRPLFKNRISRRMQYALWLIVLLRLLLPITPFSSHMSLMNLLPAAGSSAGEGPVHLSFPGFGEGEEAAVSGAPAAQPGETQPALAGAGIPGLLYGAWALGSLGLGGLFLCSHLRFKRALRDSRALGLGDYPLPVYVSPAVASPCLWGLFHPRVFLNPRAAEDPEARRFALQHELCHCRHGDHVFALLRCCCLVLWWWNPLVWLGAFLSRRDGELACDEAVTAGLGPEERFRYGRCLLAMAPVRGAAFSSGVAMVSAKSALKERIEGIMKGSRTVYAALFLVHFILVLCAGCAFTGAQAPASPSPFSGAAAASPAPVAQGEGDLLSYGLIYMEEGQVLYTLSPLPEGATSAVTELMMDYYASSQAIPGAELSHIPQCLCIRSSSSDGSLIDYYAYRLEDGSPVVQRAADGLYAPVDEMLFAALWFIPGQYGLGGSGLIDLGSGDLDRDGSPEDIRLDLSQLEESFEALLSVSGSGYIYTESAGLPHVGWNGLWLCQYQGRSLLLRYNPSMWQGGCNYVYTLFALDGSGAPAEIRSRELVFDINPGNSLPVEEMLDFAEEINGLLASSRLLVRTDEEGIFYGGEAAGYEEVYGFMDSYADEWALEGDLGARLRAFSEYNSAQAADAQG